jgi:hypothetical protein
VRTRRDVALRARLEPREEGAAPVGDAAEIGALAVVVERRRAAGGTTPAGARSSAASYRAQIGSASAARREKSTLGKSRRSSETFLRTSHAKLTVSLRLSCATNGVAAATRHGKESRAVCTHRVMGEVTTRVAPATARAEEAARAAHCCSPNGVSRAS